MATPWPSPVEPRRSRANRLSNTRLLATPWLFSNSSPACSNMRFLLVTSMSRRMFDGGRSFAIRFIGSWGLVGAPSSRAEAERRGILHQHATRRGERRDRSKGLPHADRRNLQRLPVLGYRSPRDDDALLAQYFGDLAVREGTLRVLRGDELFDERADGRGGARAAGLGRDVAAEEILELEDPALRQHELLRRHARHGGFVQSERVGDLPQDQRPHSDLAVLEEVPLAVDDGLRHAQDGLEALLDVLDQPASFLKLVRELPAGLAAVVLQDVRVHAVDAQLGHRVGVQARDPDALDLLDDDVRHHVAGLERRELRAGSRVQALDQLLRLAQLVVAALQRLPQLREVARRQELEVGTDHREGSGAARHRLRQGEQLQLQALGAVARAYPGGVEILEVLERDRQLLGLELQLLGHELQELLQRLREISVLVERLDQERDQRAVARLELGESQLAIQVLAQVRRVGRNLGIVAVVGVVPGAAAAAAVGAP